MSLLPRSIPAAELQALADNLAAAGIEFGPLKPGTRVTHTAEFGGATWKLTYLGIADTWCATGPGAEHGVAVFTHEVAAFIADPSPLTA